jgi:hypothetical protein
VCISARDCNAAPVHTLSKVIGINMSLRQRKLLGIPLLLLIIVVYASIAVFIYENWLTGAHNLILLAYFVVAGSCWFFPATWAIRWMSARPDELPPSSH